MLVQLPRGAAEAAKASSSPEVSPFEEGLRRDLASAPVVHYDPVLGGLSKRVLDIALTVASAPVWLPALLIAAGWAKARAIRTVFSTEACVGYGGRTFRRLLLRLEAPQAAVTPLHAQLSDASLPANDLDAIVEGAEDRRSKWRRALEGLPQSFNVLLGDMSLVGASPLMQPELEAVKTGRRYYLSTRPGIFDISNLVRPENLDGRFKAYALSWSLITDLLLIWDGIRGFSNRGELWRPGSNLIRLEPRANVVRRRSAP